MQWFKISGGYSEQALKSRVEGRRSSRVEHGKNLKRWLQGEQKLDSEPVDNYEQVIIVARVSGPSGR